MGKEGAIEGHPYLSDYWKLMIVREGIFFLSGVAAGKSLLLQSVTSHLCEASDSN